MLAELLLEKRLALLQPHERELGAPSARHPEAQLARREARAHAVGNGDSGRVERVGNLEKRQPALQWKKPTKVA